MSDISSTDMLQMPNFPQNLLNDPEVESGLAGFANSLNSPVCIDEVKNIVKIGSYSFNFNQIPQWGVLCIISVKLEGEDFIRTKQIHSQEEFLKALQSLYTPTGIDSFTKDHWEFDFEDNQSMPSEI